MEGWIVIKYCETNEINDTFVTRAYVFNISTNKIDIIKETPETIIKHFEAARNIMYKRGQYFMPDFWSNRVYYSEWDNHFNEMNKTEDNKREIHSYAINRLMQIYEKQSNLILSKYQPLYGIDSTEDFYTFVYSDTKKSSYHVNICLRTKKRTAYYVENTKDGFYSPLCEKIKGNFTIDFEVLKMFHLRKWNMKTNEYRVCKGMDNIYHVIEEMKKTITFAVNKGLLSAEGRDMFNDYVMNYVNNIHYYTEEYQRKIREYINKCKHNYGEKNTHLFCEDMFFKSIITIMINISESIICSLH
jgi:hypothetical protein